MTATAALAGEGTDRVRRAGPLVAATVVVAVCAAAIAVAEPRVALGVVVLGIGLVVANRPTHASMAAIALLYSNAVVIATTQHGLPGLAAAVVPMMFLVTIGYQVLVRREGVTVPISAPWVVALLIVAVVSALFSRDPEAAFAGATTLAVEGLMLFLLVSVAVRGTAQVRTATLVLVVVATLLCALSLSQRVRGAEGDDHLGFAQVSDAVVAEDTATGDPGSRRHAGPIGEQNRWAQSLAVLMPLALALAATDRSLRGRIVGAVGAVAILTGIVLTYSRGAVVGLVLAGAIAVAVRWVRPRVALACLGVALVGAMVLAPTFVARASTVATAGNAVGGSSDDDPLELEAGPDGSFSNRAVEAEAALAVFVHHPLVGVGPGLFPTYFQDEARRLGAERIVGVNRQAHNLYLGLSADVGLLGMVAFGGAIATILGPLARARRAHLQRAPDVAGLATGWAMSVVVYLTTGFFLHFAYIRYFWLIAGLAAAMGMAARPPAGGLPLPVASPARAGPTPRPAPPADPVDAVVP